MTEPSRSVYRIFDLNYQVKSDAGRELLIFLKETTEESTLRLDCSEGEVPRPEPSDLPLPPRDGDNPAAIVLIWSERGGIPQGSHIRPQASAITTIEGRLSNRL